MVRALIQQPSVQQSRSFHLKRMVELPGRQTHSLILESGQESHGSRDSSEPQRIGWALSENKAPVSCLDAHGIRARGSRCQPNSDLDLMKAKFAKLLLGEDMSGGGKGVSSALALSNAITNLAASTFGEQKLESLSPGKRTRWRREIEWFLSVTDHIVEFVPSKQTSKDGIDMEIMVTLQRKDLLMNIPALRKLDAMLLGYLDQFGKLHEFWYVSRDDESAKDDTQRNGDKWWLPAVKVPPSGLSDVTRKWLLFQKESVNQILKAAMAINAQVLTEMAVPDSYIESLPKDVGQAILESYSRVIESLAFNIMSRIEDVLYADTVARESSIEEPAEILSVDTEKQLSTSDSPASKTLSDFMGWDVDKDSSYIRSLAIEESCCKEEEDVNVMSKPGNVTTPKKLSYLEKLESLSALRSPTARH